MRRLCAILLAVTCSLGLWVPLLSGTPESQLPSCCRREGKHKCGMAMHHESADSEGNASLKTLKPVCPQFPSGKSSPAPYRADWITGENSWCPPVASFLPVAAQMDALFRISFARSAQERGPPSFLVA